MRTRLNKFLAANCGVSRREADRLIEAGRVKVNGEIISNMGLCVEETDSVELEGEAVSETAKEYYRFFKPRGILTAYGDGFGKDTLDTFPLLREKKLAYSGRLDYDSEGLIIFTNDGDLILRLQKAEFKAEKEYIVWANGDLDDTQMELIRNGLQTDTIKYLPCVIQKFKERHFKLILNEGKKRQIREIFRFFGVRVSRLLRVRIGTITIEGLEKGELQRLTEKDIMELKKCIG